MLSELCLIRWTQLSLDICFYFLKPSLKHKSQPEHCKSWLPHSSTSLKFHIFDWYNFSSYLFFSIFGSNVHATSTVQLIFSFLLNLAYYIINFRLCLYWRSHKILTLSFLILSFPFQWKVHNVHISYAFRIC